MRVILHIDMNSYFATVEQQANPRLRGKPIAVLGSKAKRTIIVASSIEAKRLGIKTGTTIEDAKVIYPKIILIHGELRKYSSTTKKFIEIFERYTDKVEIFSIDEAFLDLTETVHLFGGVEKIARLIKREIRKEIGEWVSCSIGISHNKFLAKLGSDLEKPDGLVVISHRNLDRILLSTALSDYCGIGCRLEARLVSLGVRTTADLRSCSEVLLKKEFGLCTARHLKKMTYGLDSSLVVNWREQSPAKSFSHSRTMNRNIVDQKELKKQLFFLTEKLAKKLRDEDYWTKEVGLWLRFKSFRGVGKTARLGRWSCDGEEIYHSAVKLLATLNYSEPVRAIGIYAGLVQPSKNIPKSFLPEDIKNERIVSLVDRVNNRFGEDKLIRAGLYGLKLKEVVSGMGRKKF